MSEFFSYWIIGIVALQLLGTVMLLVWTRKQSPEDLAETDTMGHDYDGIQELNMPLPKWWLNLFYATIVFALGYLVLFPGLGSLKGMLGWSAHQQWENQVEMQARNQAELFAQYASEPVESLIAYAEPMKAGQRLFNNHCSLCHGVDGKGALGYPNLTDHDWLYGGSFEQIKQSLTQGRMGMMPSFKHLAMDEQLILAQHVKSLSMGDPHALSDSGKSLFTTHCSACHGVDGGGNQAIGAPNLTDDIWLYSASVEGIQETIAEGRRGNMPAFNQSLGADKIHVVSAYVYQLSNPAPDKTTHQHSSQQPEIRRTSGTRPEVN